VSEDRWSLRRIEKSVVLSGFLGLAGGYAVFHGLFPTVTFPPESEPSVGVLMLVLLLPAFLAGLASDELVPMVLQAFLALPIVVVVATLLALSPLAVGMVIVFPDTVLAFVLHYGLPVLVIGFFVNLFVGLAGAAVRSGLFARWARSMPPSWERR
jgi:hypothetical protein